MFYIHETTSWSTFRGLFLCCLVFVLLLSRENKKTCVAKGGLLPCGAILFPVVLVGWAVVDAYFCTVFAWAGAGAVIGE